MKPYLPNHEQPGMSIARTLQLNDPAHSAHSTPRGVGHEERARIVRRLVWLARLLDDAVQIPGTKYSVGIDPIIGLVPGVGDAVSLAISAYIIYEGKRLGASQTTVAAMVGNVALDALVGLVPVLGDIADVAFKANQRNLRLLGITPARPGEQA